MGAERTMTNINDNKKLQKSASQKRGKTRRLGVLVLLIAIVAAVVLVAATRNTETVASTGGTFTVRRDNLTVTVAEAGSIRAFKSVEYNCDVERRGMQSSSITILSIVPPGTIVTQEDVDNGMVLCQLDSATLEDRLVSERMSLTSDLDNVTSTQENYEIQVLDSYGVFQSAGDCGAIYNIERPLINASFPPNTWQTYDITFEAPEIDADGNVIILPKITVIHNGVKIHDNLEIPYPTASRNRPHKARGPIELQHHDIGHNIQFRNIWLVEGE